MIPVRWLICGVSVCCAFALGCGPGPAERGYAVSPEELGRAVVDALNEEDHARLHKLRVDRQDYIERLLPVLGSGGFPPEFAWSNLNRKCNGGVAKWVRRHGGKDLNFVGLRFDRPAETYDGVLLHRGTVLTVRTPKGGRMDLRILGSVVQRGEQYKLLSYDD